MDLSASPPVNSSALRMQHTPAKYRAYAVSILSCLVLAGVVLTTQGGESDLHVPAVPTVEDTNSLQTLRTYLQLQEQLHATQIAIEENRKEANAAAARSAETLANRLQAIEQSLAAQRTRELDAMQGSTRLFLWVASGIAALG